MQNRMISTELVEEDIKIEKMEIVKDYDFKK